jgi:hypothetical protein
VTLQKLIAKFRQHMCPSLTDWAGGTLLNYPDIVLVTLYPDDQYLYKFKPCVVESMVANFAPSGPAFFNDTRAPAEVVISLQLLEIEYWVAEDVAATWNKTSHPGGVLDIFVPAGQNTTGGQPSGQ